MAPSVAEQRRKIFEDNKNVITVLLGNGSSLDRYSVEEGSYTEEVDPDISGPGGQVSFIHSTPSRSRRIVLTYAHFIVALEYKIPSGYGEER